jgi:hypothetical protein
LHVIETWKGSPAPVTLIAGAAAFSGRGPGPISLSSGMVGATGLWFLKAGTDKYRILPRVTSGYTPGDLYLPLHEAPRAAPAAAVLNDELLAAMVRWYRSLDDRRALGDVEMLLSSFLRLGEESPSLEQVTSAVAPLINSAKPAERVVGLTAALRAGSKDALEFLMKDAPALQSEPTFPMITIAISMYPIGAYAKDESWVEPLGRLLTMHRGVRGIEGAVAGALAKIRSKAVLPLMAELLDSKDPAVLTGVASYFGVFTLLANSTGEILPDAPDGPFANEQTRWYTPRQDRAVTPSQYADFWKVWWSQNRAQLGF